MPGKDFEYPLVLRRSHGTYWRNLELRLSTSAVAAFFSCSTAVPNTSPYIGAPSEK